MILNWIEFLRAHMGGLKKVLIAYLIVLILFDVLQSRAHAHYLIDKIPAYWTLFGTIGCFILIKVAKGIAHLFLGKDEDFYG